MVRPLGDAQALLEAQVMQPKPYLIYLHLVRSQRTFRRIQLTMSIQERALPFPDQPWYRFEVEPIATSLRPEDKPRGITSARDMCIPIFPNTSHPNGREPLQWKAYSHTISAPIGSTRNRLISAFGLDRNRSTRQTPLH